MISFCLLAFPHYYLGLIYAGFICTKIKRKVRKNKEIYQKGLLLNIELFETTYLIQN